ncbi:MAG: T9SS type A sorting domain-containing protein [Chitinophagaceae bacterium]|nr:MAG: T9SS type A sorting domain-containing protein [Chitinophagaceae bacterium]
MKKLYILAAALFISALSFSQTITIGGRCIQSSVTLNFIGNVDGKPAYVGGGTVLGMSGTEIGLFWLPAPDNLWVITFDGQPYFQNACNTPTPPGTSPNICPWVPVQDQTCTGAAPLSVTGAVVLPLTYLNIVATAVGNNVSLEWSTAQETNNRGFAVEHSTDGITWTEIGFVAGAGTTNSTSSYRFAHRFPAKGMNFYRLRQQDIDGRYSVSETVKAQVASENFFTISDNPGKGIYKIQMANSAEMLQLLVTDAAGKVVVNKKTAAGNQVLDISREAPGVYWLVVKKGNVQTGLKLIKL